MQTLQDKLDSMTVVGDLYEVVDADEKKIRCYACGHRCLLKDGARGICKVRYNEGGTLRVPSGYVGALQMDPIEKKPFNHVTPGAQVLSFGMMGCDFHCGYCFTPDTQIVTNQGVVEIGRLFEQGERITRPDGAEVSFPEALHAVAGSGQLRSVSKVFKHPYSGPLTVIKPYYLPALRCTPEHRVYATDDPTQPPQKIQAQHLTEKHFLVIPRQYGFPEMEQVVEAGGVLSANASHSFEMSRTVSEANYATIETDDFYLIRLRSLETEPYSGSVYNLEVEEKHNYLANFMLVSNCQNWEISQHGRDADAGRDPLIISPQELVATAKSRGATALASTYNEPLITSEWAVSVCKVARQAGLQTTYISNGNGTPEVLAYLRPYLDAYKIDLKTMQDKRYRQLGGVLQNVLDMIKMVKQTGLWTEVVTLIVPGFNDSNEELWDAARYIASVSPDIPWHVTAFHPDYRMTDPPSTTVDTLIRAAEIGSEAGLRYVYAGNIPGRVGEWEHTYCPNCHEVVVRRHGFQVLENRLAATHGLCPKCNTPVPGVWS